MAARPFLDRKMSVRILTLAGPVIAAMLTQTGVNIVDTAFLGRLPFPDNVDAQAAITPSLTLLWAVGGFLSAISVGTQAITARRYGENKFTEAGAVLPNAALVTLVGGAVFTIAGWLAMPWMFRLVVSNHHVAELGTQYCRWRFVGITSMAATAAYKSFFDGIGKTTLHLYAALAMNVFNAILCWSLIFGHLGAPAMGISGAGIAACMASWLGFLVMVGFSLLPYYRDKYRFYATRTAAADASTGRPSMISRALIANLLKLSVPSGLATVAVMTGFLIFMKIVGRLDARASAVVLHGVRVGVNGAATSIIIEVLSATFFACLAFGTATATLVGQSMGEGDVEKAERYGWTSVKLGVIIFGLMGVAIFFNVQGVLRIFAPHAPAVIAAGTVPLRIVSALGWVIAIGMILTQALFGAGETRYVMVVEMCLHFGCLVPLSLLLGIVLDYGLVGVWCAVAVYGAGLAISMSLKFAGGSWKRLKV